MFTVSPVDQKNLESGGGEGSSKMRPDNCNCMSKDGGCDSIQWCYIYL